MTPNQADPHRQAMATNSARWRSLTLPPSAWRLSIAFPDLLTVVFTPGAEPSFPGGILHRQMSPALVPHLTVVARCQ